MATLLIEARTFIEHMWKPDNPPDPCILDHHGYCHNHYGGFADGGCLAPRAWRWLGLETT